MDDSKIKPLVIADSRVRLSGKSESIVIIGKLLAETFHCKLLIEDEVKSIVTIKGINVGIMSKCNNKESVQNSIDNFLDADCRIIVAACLTAKGTYDCIEQYLHKGLNKKNEKWDMILCNHDLYWGEENEEANIKLLNYRYAERVLRLIEDRIVGII